MRTLALILFLVAAVTMPAQNAVVTGNATFTGNFTLGYLDNCTAFLCGNTNTATSSDKGFKTWFASRVDGVAGDTCRVAAIMSQNGAAVGTVSIAIFADNAGQPGSKLFESGTLNSNTVSTATTTNLFPGVAWTLTSGTLWFGVHFSDPVSIAASSDYFSIFNHFSGAATDPIYVSDDGATWADGGGRAFLCIRALKTE